MWTELGWFVLGLILLYGGAEAFIAGTRSAAFHWGISPLIAGLTLVAIATSSPELFVSLQAAYEGKGGLVLGNIIGSNVANIGLILGLAALIRPLKVHLALFAFDLPFLFGITLLFVILRALFPLTSWEGIGFLLLGVFYTSWLVRAAKKEKRKEKAQPIFGLSPSLLLIIGGIIVLIWGATNLVFGATALARRWGISETVIGLTIVAVGTSLPELAASLVASFRKQADIALGNVVGSNVYNLVLIYGLSAAFFPFTDPGIGEVSYGFFLFFPLVLWTFLRTSFTLHRWEGAILLILYAAYLLFL